jgi:hypothetical protein
MDNITLPKSLQSPERDVLLVSALISILVVLAFTDWSVLVYVVTGLVFALLFLASAIANDTAGRPTADRQSYHATGSVLPAWWDAARTTVSASSKSPRAAASAKRRACRRSCHHPSPVVATKTIAHTKLTRTRSIPRISSTPSHISAIALTCHRPRRARTAKRIPQRGSQ